ncbi:MAG: ribosomal protein S18-alanine N-acetyltransferase, partial [Methanobacteriaceae archaeon]
NILRQLFDVGAGFLVGQINDLVVGYIVFWIRNDDEGHIISLATDKKYRRLGVASQLVNQAIYNFKNFNINFVTLEVRSSNISAIEFYKSLGFTKKEFMESYYEDGEDGILMFKCII